MDCPRCESALDRYEFQSRVAYACDRCGYIGIPVEHTGSLRPVESWDDAIRRFNEKGQRANGEDDETGTDGGTDDPTPAIRRAPEPAIRRVED